MERDYILENIQSKGNYELYIPPNVKHHGYFPKGHKPWEGTEKVKSTFRLKVNDG